MTQSDDVIRVEFTFEYEDVRDAQKVGLLGTAEVKRAGMKKSYVMLGWLAAVVLGVSAMAWFYDPQKDGGNVGPVKGAFVQHLMENFWTYALLAVGVFLLIRNRNRGRKVWERAGPQKPLVIELSEKGLAWETQTSRTEYKWEHYSRMEEGETVFVLMAGTTVAVILPKRVMTEEQVGRARGLMQSRVGKVRGFEVVTGDTLKRELR